MTPSNSPLFAGRRPLLNESEAAVQLKLSVRTLQAWRLRGGGPRYLKLGRAVRYAPEILESWAAEQERANTSASTH